LKIQFSNSYTYGLFLFICFCIFIFMSLHNFISHSEFWSINSSQGFGSNLGQYTNLYYKSIFYFLLNLIYYFNLDNIQHIIASRIMFGVFAFLYFTFFLYEILKITKDYFLAIIFGIFILSIQIFFYNIFRVRADLLASLFIIISYKYINDVYFNKAKNQPIKLALLLILAFLSTPKSIYLIFAILIYYFFLNKKQNNFKNTPLLLGFFLSITLITSFTLFKFNILNENPYALAANYYLLSYNDFFAISHWSHLLTSFKINFLNYLFIIIGTLIFFCDKNFRNNYFYRANIALSFTSIIALVLYPEKWTYFIAQYIIFISIPFIFILLSLKKASLKFLIILMLLGSPLLITNRHSWFRPNTSQLNAIQFLQNLFDQVPNAIYFDSTGLLPKRNSLPGFLGPNDPLSTIYLREYIKKSPPEFIFYTTKIHTFANDLLPFLYANYTEISNDVWILNNYSKQIKLPTPAQEFSLQYLFIFDYQPFLKY
jgi:hypothetical protein